MAATSKYDRLVEVVQYLSSKQFSLKETPTTISRAVGAPYSSVRNTILKDFPHVFKENSLGGIVLSGADPIPGVSIESLRPPEPVETKPEPEPPPEPELFKSTRHKERKWIWNQEALRYLDSLFGKSFSVVLNNAAKNDALEDLIVLGKTISRAAQERKRGPVNFE